MKMKMSKIKRSCKQCGKTFKVKPYTVKTGNGKYCSQKCMGKWRSEHWGGKNNPNWRGGKIHRMCKICGNDFYVKRNEIKKRKAILCSEKCLGEYITQINWGKNNPNWRGGLSFQPYPCSFNKKLKAYIKKRDNYTCQLCEKKDCLLYVHHIDYDKTNNKNDNLITLCDVCHSTTNGNRQWWIDYFLEI